MKNVDLDEDHAPDVILMAWVKRQIHQYVLPLYNFKSCWVDGKIFVAILLNNGLLEKELTWEKLCDLSAEQRIQLAFTVAQERLKIAPILEVADLMEKPDSKCIQLYVSYLYEELKDYDAEGSISSRSSLKSLVQTVMISRTLDGANKLKEQAHQLILKIREIKKNAESVNLEDDLERVELLQKLHDENELRIREIESLRDNVESIRRDLKDEISAELWELFRVTAHVVEALQQRLGVLVMDKFQGVTDQWYEQIKLIGEKVEKLDFSLENSESLLNALLELKNAVDSVAKIIDDFPMHSSTEEDRKAVMAVVNGRNEEIEKKISGLKKFEEAKAKFELTEVRFGEAQLEKAFQRDKERFTSLLQEYNDCAYELLDLLDDPRDISLISKVKSKIDYWNQIMENQLVEPGNFENVDPRDVEVIFPQRHHIALKPMVSLVAEETEDQVRAMQETSASETEESPRQTRKTSTGSLKGGHVRRGRSSCGSIMEEKENDDNNQRALDRSSPRSDDFQPGEPAPQENEQPESQDNSKVEEKSQKEEPESNDEITQETLNDISSGEFKLNFTPSYDIVREMELKEALAKRIDEAKRVQEDNYG
ncbi:Oidioi.mRNA.OKI2018_I69.PAR.g10858.t3.cds [Oikopleura dioica]|uniref:Oidioi.mRNA.OKI2018_I69.PAR.g10858.t3.cds n=1 Tax=Oikopleura dioica TaxID=34765 RepID=A0ABN7RSR6_OIKDI|nr:Oidioi.mRNA.OKI2018_I69.PAR.g10858.t3.cds [Oikopleura dioica]